MTAAANRRKGYNYARTITAWLRDHGWPHATQRSAGQSGSDILETPLVSWEVKAVQKTALGEWCTQAARDAELEDADVLGRDSQTARCDRPGSTVRYHHPRTVQLPAHRSRLRRPGRAATPLPTTRRDTGLEPMPTDPHWWRRPYELGSPTADEATVDTTDRKTKQLLGPNGEPIRLVDVDPRPKPGFQPSHPPRRHTGVEPMPVHLIPPDDDKHSRPPPRPKPPPPKPDPPKPPRK